MTLLKPAEAAAQLGISKKTLRRLVDEGEMPCINVGCGKIRPTLAFDPEDIAAFIRNRRTYKAPPCPPVRKRRNVVDALSRWEEFDYEQLRAEAKRAKRNK